VPHEVVASVSTPSLACGAEEKAPTEEQKSEEPMCVSSPKADQKDAKRARVCTDEELQKESNQNNSHLAEQADSSAAISASADGKDSQTAEKEGQQGAVPSDGATTQAETCPSESGSAPMELDTSSSEGLSDGGGRSNRDESHLEAL